MQEIRSSGTFEAGCQHLSLTCTLKAGTTPTANTSVASLSEFRCLDCGSRLKPIGPNGKEVEHYKIPLIVDTAEKETPAATPSDRSKPPSDPAKGLPGTEMLLLTSELGIVAPPGCGCKGMATTMDRLGVEGCRQRHLELKLAIEANWEAWGWKDKLKAAKASAWKAVGLGVRPTDPVKDLVEIAIERADKKRETL